MTNRLARNSLLSSAAGLFVTLGTFLASVLVARILSVNDAGGFAYAVWAILLFVAVADLGIPATLARFIPELEGSGARDESRRLNAYLFRPLLVGVTVSLAAGAALAWMFARDVAPSSIPGPSSAGASSLVSDGTIWAFIGAAAALQIIANFASGSLRGREEFKKLAGLTSRATLVQLVGIAVGGLAFGVVGAIAGYALGSCVGVLIAFRLMRGDTTISPELRARVRRYALFTSAAAIASALVWSRIEVYFLERYLGLTEVGLFTVAMQLSSLATQGPMLLTGALLPHFSKLVGNARSTELQAYYATATRLLALIVMPACLGLSAVASAVIPMIFGEPYAEAIPAAVILVVAASVTATATVGSQMVYAMERSDFIFASSLAGAFISIAACLTLIPAFGLVGAAVGRAAVQLLLVAAGLWFTSAKLKCKPPVAGLMKIMVAAGGCALSAAAVLHLAPWPVYAALPLAVVMGALVYLALVRIIGAVSAGDAAHLRRAISVLPKPAAAAARLVLSLIAPPNRTPEMNSPLDGRAATPMGA